MTVVVEDTQEGWQASVRDGVWSSTEPGVAELLQAISAVWHGYIPDDEWSLAVIARASLANLRIVTEEPEVTTDPGVVY